LGNTEKKEEQRFVRSFTPLMISIDIGLVNIEHWSRQLIVVIAGHAYGRLVCPSGKSDSLPLVAYQFNESFCFAIFTYKRILAEPHGRVDTLPRAC